MVDSRRQLWSVAGYLNMVVEGVFGLQSDGRIAPEIPASLVPMLFGTRRTIQLHTPTQTVVLRRPGALKGNLLVAANIARHGTTTRVLLKAIHVAAAPLRAPLPVFAPATPAPPSVKRTGASWRVHSLVPATLWMNGRAQGAQAVDWRIRASTARRCFSLTTRAQGVESAPSEPICVGETTRIEGPWPREWIAPANGNYLLRLEYANTHGPINTGITAAVKRIEVHCAGASAQIVPVVMPQAIGLQRSSVARFHAMAGTRCAFALRQGFNMSFLAEAALYTGGQGGASGPLNAARIGALLISPLAGGRDKMRAPSQARAASVH
ncbi:MAG: hypothetical protein HKM03_11005 [Steroidobacteraceae bacterium]|nr:hypothetical protein [Steroidobacteraceae bacterium]